MSPRMMAPYTVPVRLNPGIELWISRAHLGDRLRERVEFSLLADKAEQVLLGFQIDPLRKLIAAMPAGIDLS